jgi:peptidoglycan/xylan/chitin deacetylase (PgdA/CDA1 family)
MLFSLFAVKQRCWLFGSARLYCVWVFVLRIHICLLGIGLLCSIASPASAACGPHVLGTSRTITLDAVRSRSVSGKESSLGLHNKEVILTFDDGPIAGKTPRILQTLKEQCVKATFFSVGKMARAYPRLARRIVRQGHTLAHHTHDHDRLPSYSLDEASRLIDRGIADVQKIVYGDPSSTPRTPFFRYPYLDSTRQTDRLLAEKGLISIGANIDSLDWKSDTAQTVHDRIMRRLRKQGRGIILMHDIQTRTAKMLPDLLESLKIEGYSVVHMVPGRSPTLEPESLPVVVASVESAKTGAPSIQLKQVILDGRVEPTRPAGPTMVAMVSDSIPYPTPTKYRSRKDGRSDPGKTRQKSVNVVVSVEDRPKPASKPQKIARRRSVGPAKARFRRTRRKPAVLLFAGVKPRGTIHVGSWAVRRSQWVLR